MEVLDLGKVKRFVASPHCEASGACACDAYATLPEARVGNRCKQANW
jgi:hypothetical protein